MCYKRFILIFLMIFVVVASVGYASIQEIKIEANESRFVDTMLDSFFPIVEYSTNVELRTGSGYIILFNTTEACNFLPANYSLISIKLALYINGINTAPNFTAVYPIISAWSEQETWNSFIDGGKLYNSSWNVSIGFEGAPIDITQHNISLNVSWFNQSCKKLTNNNGGIFINASTERDYYSTNNLAKNPKIYIVYDDLTPTLYNESVNSVYFYNTIEWNDTTYVRDGQHLVNVSCYGASSKEVNLTRYINGVATLNDTVTCFNDSVLLNYSFYFNNSGIYSLLYKFNNSVSTNYTLTSDLFAPNITFSKAITEGFNSSLLNTSFSCYDDVMKNVSMFLKVNNKTYVNNAYNNASTLLNSSVLPNTSVYIYASCSDLFGITEYVESANIYYKTLILIDEVNNVPFDVSNLSIARLYYDDNRLLYDFKAANSTRINFTGEDKTTLRLQLGYYSSGEYMVTRYIDVSLFNTSDIRICANSADVTHYKNVVFSATQKSAMIKNIYSDCYIVAYNTVFAYGTTKSIPFYTIDSKYNLYHRDDDGNMVVLTNIDGGLQADINLDSLEFYAKGYNIDISLDSWSFATGVNPDGSAMTKQIEIRYLNLDNDNSDLSFNIYNMDDDELLTTVTDFDDPNNIVTYFNFVSVDNVTDNTAFKLVATLTKSNGEIETQTRYFNVFAKKGVLQAGLVFAMAILLLAFGLTFASSVITFSWFGLLVELAALILTSLSMGVWYIYLLQAIIVICMVYTFMILLIKNYTSVS